MARQSYASGEERATRGIHLLVLGGIILWSVGHTVIWLWIDTRPPRWDEAWYLTMSLKYQQALTSGGVLAFLKAWLTVDPQRPSLVSALAVPIYFLFGTSPDVALVVNCLAFVVLILAVYGLGRRLAGPRVGLFAAFLVGTYPGVYALARVFMLDFCNATLVAVALYLLLRTEIFAYTRASLLLGVTIGLGMLCRAFFPIFLVGPVVVTLYGMWRVTRQSGDAQVHRLRNMGLTLLVALGVTASWYAYNLVPVIKRSLSAAYGAEAFGYGPTNPFTWIALCNYLINFMTHISTMLGLLLFLIAIVVLWKQWPVVIHEEAREGTFPGYEVFLLLSSLLVAYLFFTTLPSQDTKNTAPMMPAMALVTAWGLMLVRSTWLRRLLVGGGGAGMVFQFWLGTYGLAAFPQEISIATRPDMPWVTLIRQAPMANDTTFFLPQRAEWPLTDILWRVTGGEVGPNDARTLAQPVTFAIIPDHPVLNFASFYYYTVLLGFPVNITHPGDPRIPEGRDYRRKIWEADFALIKTEQLGLQWINVNNDAMVEFLRSPDSGFVEVSPRYPLPDGSEAVLYAAGGSPVVTGTPEIQHRVTVQYGDAVEFLGYTIEEKGPTGKGQAFLVHYYWKPLQTLAHDYRVFVHVTKSQAAETVAWWDHFPARGRYPTSLWQPGTIIHDQGVWFLPHDGSPETFTMRIGLMHPSSGERLPIVHADAGIVLDEENSRAAVGTIQLHESQGRK